MSARPWAQGGESAGRVSIDGRDTGAAFTVAPDLALTARHVLRRALDEHDRLQADRQVVLTLPGHPPLRVLSCHCDRRLDVAALTLATDSRASTSPPPPTTPLAAPDGGAHWRVLTRPRPNDPALSGRVTVAQQPYRNHDGHDVVLTQLGVEQDLGDYGGYSGSPVLVWPVTGEPTSPPPAFAVLVEQVFWRTPGPEAHRAAAVLVAAPIPAVLAALGLPTTLLPAPTASLPKTLTARLERALEVTQWVTSLAFSPDGIWLATASRQRVRVWDLRSGHLAWSQKIGGLTHDVVDVAFSPDGQQLATASWDKTARLFDVRTGHELWRVEHDAAVEAVAFSPDGRYLASSGRDKTTRVHDIADRQQLQRLRQEDTVCAVAFSPDGRSLASAGSDKTTRIWDVHTGQEQRRLQHDGVVRAVAFSPHGLRLATAGEDRSARIWNLDTGQQAARVRHDNIVLDATFGPDGDLLATASNDKTARIVNASTGEQLLEIARPELVWAIAFSPDGRILATGGRTGTVHLWTLTQACSRVDPSITAESREAGERSRPGPGTFKMP